MKKIQILIGSNSKKSIHKKLGEYIIKEYCNLANFEILTINNLPFYCFDDENDKNEEVLLFLEKLQKSDGVILMTPEYNNSIPGVLKNALDWASRGDYVLSNKPILIMGITPSILGTVRAQDHTRLILSHPVYSARILPGQQILINQSYNKMDENGNIVDEATKNLIENRLKDFIKFI